MSVLEPDVSRLSGVRRPNAAAAYRQALQHDPCAYGGAPFHGYREIDHIVPRSKGGPNHWSNYTAACGGCNVLKYDNSMLAHLLAMERLAHLDVEGALAIGRALP